MKILRLLKIFTVPFNLLYSYLYPVKYAKKLGVNMKGLVTIYGNSYKMFSSEPFLVTLGDNVYITLNTKIICRDGYALAFRKDITDLGITKIMMVGNNAFI